MPLQPLTTARGEELLEQIKQDPGRKPWDVYPRPRLVRESWINLNGFWDYAVSDGPQPAAYGMVLLD